MFRGATQRQRRCLQQIGGSVLSICLLGTQVVFVHSAETNLWSNRRKSIQLASARPTSSLPALTLPALPASRPPLSLSSSAPASRLGQLMSRLAVHGTVQQVTPAKSHAGEAPVIVSLRDVHGHTEAQKNIASLISSVLEQDSKALIGLEGAEGPLSMDAFRSTSGEINRETGSFLLNAGLISGAEYAGFTSEQPASFIGVENANLYRWNVSAVRQALAQQRPALAQLGRETEWLENEKQRAYTSRLKNFDAQWISYLRGKTTLGDYVQYLTVIAPSTYPEINLFLKAWKLEQQLDVTRAEGERNAVLERLSGTLSKQDLARLYEQSVALRAGRLPYPQFYRNLRLMAAEAGVPLSRYTEFDRYIGYVILADSIKPAAVLSEIEKYEQEVAFSLCRTGEQRMLVRVSFQNELNRKLARLTLTPDEWQVYRQGRSRRFLRPFEAFYTAAEARNEALVANLKKGLVENKTRTAVLVAGGFHSDGINRLLTDSGYTVVSVTPKMVATDARTGNDANDYLSVFTRAKTPLENIFDSPRLTMVMTTATKPIADENGAPLNPAANVVKAIVQPLHTLFKSLLEKGTAQLNTGLLYLAATRNGVHPASEENLRLLMEGTTETGTDVRIWATEEGNRLTKSDIQAAPYYEWWLPFILIIPGALTAYHRNTHNEEGLRQVRAAAFGMAILSIAAGFWVYFALPGDGPLLVRILLSGLGAYVMFQILHVIRDEAAARDASIAPLAGLPVAGKPALRLLFADALASDASMDNVRQLVERYKAQGHDVEIIDAPKDVGQDPAAFEEVIKETKPTIIIVRSGTAVFHPDEKKGGKPELWKMAAENGVREIIRAGVGYDNIDPVASAANNITLARTHGSANSVSDIAMRFLIAGERAVSGETATSSPDVALEEDWHGAINLSIPDLQKGLGKSLKDPKRMASMTADEAQAVFSSMFASVSARDVEDLAEHLNGKTVGVVGTSAIALAFIRKLHALRKLAGITLNIQVTSQSVENGTPSAELLAQAEKLKFTLAKKSDVLKNSDILSLHIPGNAKTKNYVSAEDLKDSRVQVVINTARQSLMDSKIWDTPPPFHYFADVDLTDDLVALMHRHPSHVHLIPHIGASTQDAADGVEKNLVPTLQASFDQLLGLAPSTDFKLDIQNGMALAPLSTTTKESVASDVTLSINEREFLIRKGRALGDVLADRSLTRPGETRTPVATTPDNIDTIVVFGIAHTLLAERAADAFLKARPNRPGIRVVFSGGIGRATPAAWQKAKVSEAHMLRRAFLERVRQVAPPVYVELMALGDGLDEILVLEETSTNSGANVINTRAKLDALGITPQSVLLMQGPYLQLRAYATWMRQAGFPDAVVCSFAPFIPDLTALTDRQLIGAIKVMIGEAQRLRDYPEKNYTIPVAETPYMLGLAADLEAAIGAYDVDIHEALQFIEFGRDAERSAAEEDMESRYQGMDSWGRPQAGRPMYDPVPLGTMRDMFHEQDGRLVPIETDILSVTADQIPDSVRTFAQSIVQEWTDIVGEGDHYVVDPQTYHLSLYVAQDRPKIPGQGAGVMKSNAERLTQEEILSFTESLREAAQGTAPFRLVPRGVRTGPNGFMVLIFEYEPNVVGFRNALADSATRNLANRSWQRPSGIISMTLFRHRTNVVPDEDQARRIAAFFDKYRDLRANLLPGSEPFDVDQVSLSHETRWMHVGEDMRVVARLGEENPEVVESVMTDPVVRNWSGAAVETGIADITPQADHRTAELHDERILDAIVLNVGPLQRNLVRNTFDFEGAKRILNRRLAAQLDVARTLRSQGVEETALTRLYRNAAYLAGRSDTTAAMAEIIMEGDGKNFNLSMRMAWAWGRFLGFIFNRLAWIQSAMIRIRSTLNIGSRDIALLHVDDLLWTDHEQGGLDTAKYLMETLSDALRQSQPRLLVARIKPGMSEGEHKAQLVARLRELARRSNRQTEMERFLEKRAVFVFQPEGQIQPSQVLEEARRVDSHQFSGPVRLAIYSSTPEHFDLHDSLVRFVIFALSAGRVVPVSIQILGARVYSINA